MKKLFSKLIQNMIWLTENEIPFIVFDGDEDCYSEILNVIKEIVYAMP